MSVLHCDTLFIEHRYIYADFHLAKDIATQNVVEIPKCMEKQASKHIRDNFNKIDNILFI